MMRTMRGDRTSVRLADPVGALARGRKALKPDGKVLLVEPYAVRTAIGKVLRSRYKVPQHLAHEMIALLIRADALREGDKKHLLAMAEAWLGLADRVQRPHRAPALERKNALASVHRP